MIEPFHSRLNLANAWIDDQVKFNLTTFQIERDSAVAVDCPKPGDAAAVKAVILGAWEGG